MSVATITGKIGPGVTVTATTLTNVTAANYDFVNRTVQIFCDQGKPLYDIAAGTTLTITVSGLVYTLVVS